MNPIAWGATLSKMGGKAVRFGSMHSIVRGANICSGIPARISYINDQHANALTSIYLLVSLTRLKGRSDKGKDFVLLGGDNLTEEPPARVFIKKPARYSGAGLHCKSIIHQLSYLLFLKSSHPVHHNSFLRRRCYCFQ
jgi:hypothetical protein